ncbi:hypothetical protein ACKLNO_08760 [Neisseriaceae bacterium B1]
MSNQFSGSLLVHDNNATSWSADFLVRIQFMPHIALRTGTFALQVLLCTFRQPESIYS